MEKKRTPPSPSEGDKEPKPIKSSVQLKYFQENLPYIKSSNNYNLTIKIIQEDGIVIYSDAISIYSAPVFTTKINRIKINSNISKDKKYIKNLEISNVYKSDCLYMSFNGYSILGKIDHKMNFHFTNPAFFYNKIKTVGGNIKEIYFYGGIFDPREVTNINSIRGMLPYIWQREILINRQSRVAFANCPVTIDGKVTNTQIPLSLGFLGRILIKFIKPVNSIEFIEHLPGEYFEVRFGNRTVNRSELEKYTNDLSSSTGKKVYDYRIHNKGRIYVPDGKFLIGEETYDYKATKGKSKFVSKKGYPFIEIFDAFYGYMKKQPKIYPGLDITNIVSLMPIKKIYVVLDISGSMSDNEGGGFYRSGKLEPATAPDGTDVFSSRLYSIVAKAIKNSLLPGGETGTVNINLVTFYGEGDTIKKEGNNIVIEKKSKTIKFLPAGNKKSFIDNIDSEIKLLKNNGYHDKTPVKSAIFRALHDVNKDSSVKEDDPSLVIVITDGAGENAGESLNDLNNIKPWGKTGVIEYIGYHLYHLKPDVVDVTQRKFLQRKEPIEKLYDFSKHNQKGNWMVHPHIVNKEIELNELLKNLSKKYNL